MLRLAKILIIVVAGTIHCLGQKIIWPGNQKGLAIQKLEEIEISIENGFHLKAFNLFNSLDSTEFQSAREIYFRYCLDRVHVEIMTGEYRGAEKHLKTVQTIFSKEISEDEQFVIPILLVEFKLTLMNGNMIQFDVVASQLNFKLKNQKEGLVVQMIYMKMLLDFGFNPKKGRWPMGFDLTNAEKLINKGNGSEYELYYRLILVLYFSENASLNNHLDKFERFLKRNFSSRDPKIDEGLGLIRIITATTSQDLKGVFLPDCSIDKIKLYNIIRERKNNLLDRELIEHQMDYSTKLAGPKSYEFHISRIDMANLYVRQKSNLSEALDIYEREYIWIKNQLHEMHVEYLQFLVSFAKLYELNDSVVNALKILDEAISVAIRKYAPEDPQYLNLKAEFARLSKKMK